MLEDTVYYFMSPIKEYGLKYFSLDCALQMIVNWDYVYSGASDLSEIKIYKIGNFQTKHSKDSFIYILIKVKRKPSNSCWLESEQ